MEKEAEVINKSEQVIEGGKFTEISKKNGRLITAEEIQEGRVSWSACKTAIYACNLFDAHCCHSQPAVCVTGRLAPDLVLHLFPWKFTIREDPIRGTGHSCMIVALSRVSDAFIDMVDRMVGRAVRSFQSCRSECRLVSTLRSEGHLDLLTGNSYLGVFMCIMFASSGFQIMAASAFVFGIVRAAKRIHRLLIDAILGTTLRCDPPPPEHICFFLTIRQLARHNAHLACDHTLHSGYSDWYI
jgi:hypothetical protein